MAKATCCGCGNRTGRAGTADDRARHVSSRASRRRARKSAEYHLQAGIAACHCAARDYASTDWRQILSLYDRLVEFDDSPVVALNRAVALAETPGPQAGIAAVGAIRPTWHSLESYYLLYAVLGEFESRLNHAAGGRGPLPQIAATGGNQIGAKVFVGKVAGLRRTNPGLNGNAAVREGRAGSPLPAAPRECDVNSSANARRRAEDCPPYRSRSSITESLS